MFVIYTERRERERRHENWSSKILNNGNNLFSSNNNVYNV